MASANDVIMLVIKAKDNASDTIAGITNKFDEMGSKTKAAIGGAITAASAAMLSFSKDAIQSAMTAETEWARFGAAVDASGGNWEEQSSEIKKWCRDFSDSMGRATSDTRAAMTAYMNYGMSLEQSQSAMEATAGLAAASGKSEEEASQMIIQACNGRGMALARLGIDVNNYKDEVTGAIDQEKLFAAIQEKFGKAGENYAKSTAGQMQTVKNEIASLKTEFGNALLSALKPLIPVVKSILDAFSNLPGPVKTGLFLIVGAGAAIGLLAGPIMSVVGLLEALGIIGPVAGAGASTAGAGAAAGSAGVWSLGAAMEFLMSPITLIVIAILALIAVIYLVGQYFGLWNDPMEMCQVILGALAGALQYVAGILMGVFKAAWDTIMNTVSRIVTFVQTLWNTLMAFANGQITISQVVVTVWNALNTLFGGILNKLIMRVVQFAVRFVSQAISAAASFVSGLIGGIMSLPARVWGIFQQIIQKIQQAVSAAGQAARNVAQAIWDGLTGKLGEAASWIQDNVINPVTNAWNAVTNGGGSAGSADLPTTALEAGTYIGTGYLGRTGNVSNTKKSSKSTVNVGEINLKLDNVSDTQAKRILVQALEGLEQVREVRTV